MSTNEPVRIEVTLPAPVSAVWPVLRRPAQIRRWFGWDYDGLDDEIRSIFGDETEASEADKTLQIGGHLLTLEECDHETVIRVIRSTPASGEGDWVNNYEDIEEGWLTFLQQLRFMLGRHQDEDRRVVYATGQAVTPVPLPAPELLGMPGLATAAPGQRHEGVAAWGEPVTGVVWFRSALQLGLTVDSWGDGLLIVSESPSAGTPQRAASMVATTYGLDDTTFERLQERLNDWWSAHFRAGDTAEPAGAP